ncbi:25S rRNA (uridine-N(3))-methyltransferase [Psilocybe cubensis]|uniref:25S rRNA (Uridine-N(3))-methyltransferase n=2 Tax=Psilocybe cubensis TaxID=181762 RepID=A0ACB8HF36_PSICU|nr:25S rRNA (uridine-N(3))-methyltransferase [Psilocybe cubensis]KAH9486444.1 25S rRNA (uridine-N(3))-methyltransferase [Psilocybe cubensis]
MGKAGKGLKSALLSQQSRLKAKQKLSHAAQVAEQKIFRMTGKQPRRDAARMDPTRDTKGKGKAIPQTLRPTIPFNPTDKILLIGEGNFSFSRSLILDAPIQLQSLPPNNVTATAYDSEEECFSKYPEAEGIVSFLRSKGVEVIFGVDGTRLEKHPRLKGRKWDRIVFNFPHAGELNSLFVVLPNSTSEFSGKGIADQDRNILSNQILILGFLRSAPKVLQVGPVPSIYTPRKKKRGDDDEDEEMDPIKDVVEEVDEMGNPIQFFVPSDNVTTRGTVLITLRNVIPYTQWDVPRLAKNPPLVQNGSNTKPNPKYTLLRSFQFHRNIWKGYEHRMTKGERAHGKGTTGDGGEDRTWEFCIKDEPDKDSYH